LEPIRDLLLTASGELDRRLLGQAQMIYGNELPRIGQPRTIFDVPRRTVYLPVNRAALDEAFSTFDYVDPAVSLEKRPSTTVPHQVLFLLNHPLALHSAGELAQRALRERAGDRERIELIYGSLLTRRPSEAELQLGLRYVQMHQEQMADPSEKVSDSAKKIVNAWASYCRALLLTNEVLYVD
jgi:hypothetical protein